MKNILLVWNGMAVTQVSGGDMYTKKLVERSGLEFDLILPQTAADILDINKVKTQFVIDNNTASSSLALIWLYSKRIFKSIQIIKRNRREYTAVVASSPFMHDLIPALFVKKANRAVILFHILPDRKSTNIVTRVRFILARIEQKYAFIIIKKYFPIILAGNSVVEAELRNRFPNKRIIIAHAGIDTKKIDATKDQLKDHNLGIFVGRLTVQKGILDLVKIAKIIESQNPKFSLMIVGNGPDKALLERHIKDQGVKSISLKGFVDESTKYKLMKQAKFFLFPSREEGWGIALAEAMYCECLSLCYELPHYRGLFEDYPEYVELDNYSDFAERLIKIYSAKPKHGQKNFFAKYDDQQVIEDVIRLAGLRQ